MCGLSVRFYCIAIFLLLGSFILFYFILVENRNFLFINFAWTREIMQVLHYIRCVCICEALKVLWWSNHIVGRIAGSYWAGHYSHDLIASYSKSIIFSRASSRPSSKTLTWMRNNRLTSEAWNVIDMNNFEESPRVYCEHMKLQGFRYVWRRKKNFCVNNNLRCKNSLLEISWNLLFDDFFFNKIYEEEFFERFFNAWLLNFLVLEKVL